MFKIAESNSILIRYAQENVIKILVGNKSDMNEKRRVTFEEGQELGIYLFI